MKKLKTILKRLFKDNSAVNQQKRIYHMFERNMFDGKDMR